MPSASLQQIQQFIEALVPRMKKGGRLFYIGAGTSGRLGVLDASECPPTFGVDPTKVQGWIAGGDGALRVAVEGAEDDPDGAWHDLGFRTADPTGHPRRHRRFGTDALCGGRLEGGPGCRTLTACITCNPDSAVVQAAEHPMVAVTGPEFVTGSTRLNAGTATKLILNLISTTAMIQLGHVGGFKNGGHEAFQCQTTRTRRAHDSRSHRRFGGGGSGGPRGDQRRACID